MKETSRDNIEAPQTYSSADELDHRRRFFELFRSCPIPEGERLGNLGLFQNRQSLSRLFFMHELYQRIIPVHGVIMEFGVRWGQNLALFSTFRGMHEPYNFNRKLVGFDTFAGFPGVSEKDGRSNQARPGEYGVTRDYQSYLDAVLDYHEKESPLSHIKKHELVAGDVMETLPAYLERSPETIVALAYFDLDLYEPTKFCLEAIRDRLPRGAVVAFDELNCREFPGETRAVMEALGLANCRLQRTPHNPTPCFMVVE
ncbi:MAG: crotonobetainyl-CoA--carnitine CoA-transferase [Planctomycetes bacterium]|nr:crotonobetainyl-CoA--carnitine CoA-transferase [Planctomycetota bacterium]